MTEPTPPPSAPDDAWGRFSGRTDGARELWIRPGHLAERQGAIELLHPSEAIFVVARWAAEDFAQVESLHRRAGGAFGALGDAGGLGAVDSIHHAFAQDPDEHRARVLADLEEAFRSGRLVMHATTRRHAPGPRPIEPALPAPARPASPSPRPHVDWIEVSLVDEAGSIVAEEPVLVRDPSGAGQTLTTDEHGVARLGGIDRGICEISFPRIDGREWARRGQTFPKGTGEVARERVVRPRECMTRIAYDERFRSATTLYDHPANAELKKLRPNPDILCPGDRVQVLARDERVDEAATGMRHPYVVKTSVRWLRVVLHQAFREPLRDTEVRVEIGGREAVVTATNTEGLLEVPIPRWAEAATIVTPSYRWPVALASILPMEDVPDDGDAGARRRLANLGVHAVQPPVNRMQEEGHDPETSMFNPGVWDFQRDHGLPETGQIDEATARAIVDIYGH